MLNDDARCINCGAQANAQLCAACENDRIYERAQLETRARRWVQCIF